MVHHYWGTIQARAPKIPFKPDFGKTNYPITLRVDDDAEESCVRVLMLTLGNAEALVAELSDAINEARGRTVAA